MVESLASIVTQRNVNDEFVEAVVELLMPSGAGARRSLAAHAVAVVVTAVAKLAVSKISGVPAAVLTWLLRTHARLRRALRLFARSVIRRAFGVVSPSVPATPPVPAPVRAPDTAPDADAADANAAADLGGGDGGGLGGTPPSSISIGGMAASVSAMLDDEVCATVPEFVGDAFSSKPNALYGDLTWFHAYAAAADASHVEMQQVADAAAGDLVVSARNAAACLRFPHLDGGACVRLDLAPAHDAMTPYGLKRPPNVVRMSTRASGSTTGVERLRTFVEHVQRQRAEARRDVGWKPVVHSYVCGAWVGREVPNRKRFEHVALAAPVKAALIADLEAFLANEAAFEAKGLRWNRGYLLHGLPGCGKSSCIAAMSARFHLPLYLVNLQEVPGDDSLRAMFGALPRRVMVVLEDVDCMSDAVLARAGAEAGEGRDANGAAAAAAAAAVTALAGTVRKRVTLSGLLNVLDGLETGSGRVLVMTTNHRHALDPALVRPGRCDVHVELGPCTMEHVDFLLGLYLGPPAGAGAGAPVPWLSGEMRATVAALLEGRAVTPAAVAGILMPMALAATLPTQLATLAERGGGDRGGEFVRQLTDLCRPARGANPAYDLEAKEADRADCEGSSRSSPSSLVTPPHDDDGLTRMSSTSSSSTLRMVDAPLPSS